MAAAFVAPSFLAHGDRAVIVKNTFLDLEEPSRDSRRTRSLPRSCRACQACFPLEVSTRAPTAGVCSDAVSTTASMSIVGGTSSVASPFSVCMSARTRTSSVSSMASESCSRDTATSPAVVALAGRLWSLCQDPRGSRQVQAALDDCIDDASREAIASELRGHILEASRCPHANHVVQKCLSTLRPAAAQFIVDEVSKEDTSQFACEKFGCRVLQRLFDCCGIHQVHDLVEDVLADLQRIATDAFGNYVVQCLFEHGTNPEQRRRLISQVEQGIVGLGSETTGCIVISAALTKSAPADRAKVARSLLAEPTLLVQMACDRHGHRTVLELLGVSMISAATATVEAAAARLLLAGSLNTLLSCRFGRVVAGYLV